MIIEALAVWGAFRWFTHRCHDEEPSKGTEDTSLLIDPEHNISLGFKSFSPKKIRIWSPECPVEVLIFTKDDRDLWRSGKSPKKIGIYEEKDDGKFFEIRTEKHQDHKLYIVIANWSKNKMARIWYTVEKDQDPKHEPNVESKKIDRGSTGNPALDNPATEASV